METITNLQEFNGTVVAFQKKHRKFYTNCYFMPEELAGLIADRKLHLSKQENALLILCRWGDYCSLYYYLAKDAPLPNLAAVCQEAGPGTEVLLDAIYPENRPRRDILPLSQMLAAGKIREYKHYQRMSLQLTGLGPSDYPYELGQGYRLMERPPSHPETLSLWKAALDEKSTPLPDGEQLKEMREKGRLICVESTASGQLSAVAALDIHGKQGMLQHLAVLPEHRRHGLARCLCRMIVRQGIESGLRIMKLWVDCGNSPATALYRQEGFLPEGIRCDQHILERSNIL